MLTGLRVCEFAKRAGKRRVEVRASMQRTEHNHRVNYRKGQLRRDVGGNEGKTQRPDAEILARRK